MLHQVRRWNNENAKSMHSWLYLIVSRPLKITLALGNVKGKTTEIWFVNPAGQNYNCAQGFPLIKIRKCRKSVLRNRAVFSQVKIQSKCFILLDMPRPYTRIWGISPLRVTQRLKTSKDR